MKADIIIYRKSSLHLMHQKEAAVVNQIRVSMAVLFRPLSNFRTVCGAGGAVRGMEPNRGAFAIFKNKKIRYRRELDRPPGRKSSPLYTSFRLRLLGGLRQMFPCYIVLRCQVDSHGGQGNAQGKTTVAEEMHAGCA